MRSIRANLDRAGAFALACFVAAIGACASEDGAVPTVTGDASPDAVATLPDGGPTPDAAISDSDTPFDAGPPLHITCAQQPCVTAITADDAFCALLDNGKVECWGNINSSYQLGRGLEAGVGGDLVPAPVLNVENAVSVRGTCAIEQGGVAKCWGRGNYLQVVDGGPRPATSNQAPTAVTLPLPPVKSLSVNSDTLINAGGCAVLVTGELQCWGYAITFDWTFLDAGGTAYQEDTNVKPTKLALPAAAVDVNVGVATMLRDATGAALSFGNRSELGRTSSLKLDPYPAAIELSDVSSVDVRSSNVCAVARGKVYCWGTVENGPLERALPTQVLLTDPAVFVATVDENPGTPQPYPFACAITTKHELWCWGANPVGQLGDGTTNTLALSPVHITLPGPVVEVRATINETCALIESGQVYCWGGESKTASPKAIAFQ